MKKLISLSILILGSLLLAACAKQVPLSVPPELGQSTWQKFINLPQAPAGAYTLNGSLRYGTTSDMRRVTWLLWSNGQNSPLRLDLMAGINTVVAKIREASEGFIAFMPTENKAIVHEGQGRVLLDLGIPVPFGVTEFANLAQADFHAIFGDALGLTPHYTADGITYTLAGSKLLGELTLNLEGQPVRFVHQDAWIMTIKYAENLPDEIKLEYKDRQAILLIKGRQARPNYNPKQLEFVLPPDTVLEQAS